MGKNADRPRRRSIRLPGYDYTSSGAYFITICTHRGELRFGEIVDGGVVLNDHGQAAHEEWLASEQIRQEIELDVFVIMPNHLHGIVWIRKTDDEPEVGAQGVGVHEKAHGRAPLRRPPPSLGSFVAGYKSAVTARINRMRGTPGTPVWQRNYWEHIIRDDVSLNEIRAYIESNPVRWDRDQLHPDAPPNPFNRWQS
jgi:putative transposase